jgi:glycosyltransferase involved in cell wall biosynthesis
LINTPAQDKTAVVIPFFNEEESIFECIQRTLPFADFIIAVDDGSTDNSVSKIPADNKIILIRLKENTGKGNALNEGFKKSIELNTTVTLTIDADLQHPPENIPDFIDAIFDYEIVIGSRRHALTGMHPQRIFSNLVSSYLLSKKTGMKIIDSQSGYRAYRTEILPIILPRTAGFEAESEILINAAKNNFKIGFVDIPLVKSTRKSKIKPVRLIVSFLRLIFK